MAERKPSPEETRIINTHVAAILKELNEAGIYSNAILAFVTLEGWDYHLAMMLAREVEDTEGAMDELTKYVHDELCERISGVQHRAAPTPDGGRVEGIIMDRVVTGSMSWRQRLESIRKLPREGAERISISTKLLEDVIAALDHIDNLEAGIRECESDGGCRATKVVKEEEGQRPLTN